MEALGPLAPLMTEAVKTWGVFTILLAMLGLMLWNSWRQSKSKDAKIEKLEAENARLQELRLQDAREMIRVAETGTATMAARSEGDARFRELFSSLVTEVAHLAQTSQQKKPKKPLLPLPSPESR